MRMIDLMLENRRLKKENMKLRALVAHMYTCKEYYDTTNGTYECDFCPLDNDVQLCDFERRMKELRIEVDA